MIRSYYVGYHFNDCVSGILRGKTMDDKLMNVPTDEKQNYPFYILKLFVEKIVFLVWNKNSLKESNK